MLKVAKRNFRTNTLLMTYCALLISISYIGSLIKIQGTSIALDSMPAYFAALFLTPAAGALVGFLAHLITAATSGFYLTLPMHIIISIQMAAFVYVFGWTYKKSNYLISAITATFLNGPVAALIVVPFSVLFQLPLRGWELFYFMLIPLTLASLVNIIMAVTIHKLLPNRVRNGYKFDEV
ncbi:ECF transporter S component [Proteinivorax tanatarense]|uniref:ECF transporter S component n=1 Tax=Proteinivorax tanatarense TaxID=1260629 RepID=A0AAU7VJ49_9FIRM